MILLIIWILVLVTVVVLYFRQLYSRFNRYGVKYVRPYPIVGNMDQILLRRRHIAYDLADLYNSFPDERFVGRFEFLSQMVVIRDLELVKKITIKDFEHFLDHRAGQSSTGTFFEKTLFFMSGQEWKDMRSTLSPAFTSSKMRAMVPLMVEVGNQMMKSLKKKLLASNDGYIDVECKDLTSRYANDVIASCVFGLKVDSHTEEQNQFYANAKKTATFKFRQMIVFFLMTNFPTIVRFFKLDIFSEESQRFLSDLVINTMNERELRKIIRPDMVNILMQAKKGKITHEEKNNDMKADTGFATVEESSVGKQNINRAWTNEDLIAQGAIFFIAGYEGVSSGMSFLMYELAMNPDVQERLAQEIRDHDAKSGGKFDFNSIQSMTYLDMVVSELLRLWSPAVALDRICVKDYNLGKPNNNSENDFIIRKGTGIMIPVYGFHRDPYFYPDPDKFDPERFSDVNKHKIHPLAYMPFGVGPRNCIGSRFALCELKVMIYQILQHIQLSPCGRTSMDPQLATDSFNIKLKEDHWLRLRARI